MAHSKIRRRHEIASWWLPTAPTVPLAQPLNSDPVNRMEVGELKVMNEENDGEVHTSGANADDAVGAKVIYSLKEGENWLTFGDDDSRGNPKISMVHGMFQKAGTDADAKGGKMEVGSQSEHHRIENESGNLPLRVLCIDVDNSSECLAVKDICACAKKCQLDFYLVRRKRLRGATSYQRNHGKNIITNEKDAATYESDEMSSSGYTSDDEKDDREDVHDECTDTNNGTISEETAVDSDGHNLYESPERLPRRQLRVLRDGDRIVIRYSPSNATNDSLPRIAKLEYMYARKKRPHSRKSDHYRMKGTKCTAEATGKPRLLSVKSDVKSDCKKKFKTNDTSAAEAPSDDDISVKATKNDDHKAGKDWSASPEKNASQGADDEDDGMEEYSYLTGEIVIKDQDWVSAITGDETTPVQLNDHGRWDGNENDAATASAVVVGARTASPSAKHRVTSPTAKCRKEKEVSFDANFSPKKVEHEQMKGNSDLQIMETKEDKSNNNEDVFLTAPEHLEDPEKNSREEESSIEQELELLSQQSSLKDTKNDDDLTDDPEQTQPISATLMAEYNLNDAADDSKLSTVYEKEEHIDHDDSTTGPESPVKLPSQVEVKSVDGGPRKNEVRFSQLTAPSPETKAEEDETDDDVYNASTQLFIGDFAIPSASQPDNDEYNAETQFVPPQDLESAELREVGDKPIKSVEPPGIVNPKEGNVLEPTIGNRTKADGEKVEVCENSADKVNGVEPVAKSGSRTGDEASAEFAEIEAGNGGDGETTTKSSSSHKQEQEVSMSPKLSSPKQRSAHDNSGLLDDTAIHRDRNGAMMTGSVGGANLGDLLTSIALQSTPNFPEAAMSHKSSEETTVVNDKGTKEFMNNSEHTKNRKSGRNTNSPDETKHVLESQQKNTKNNNAGSTRSIGVPSEVFVETPTKKRRSSRANKADSSASVPSRERLKRNRRGVSMDSHGKVRVMFTGVDITATHRKVCAEF